MKRLTAILALLAMLPLMGACASDHGMLDAANWFSSATNGRDTSLTFERAARESRTSGLNRVSDSVSVRTAATGLSRNVKTSLTVERAANAVNDGGKANDLSFFGAARGITRAKGR